MKFRDAFFFSSISCIFFLSGCGADTMTAAASVAKLEATSANNAKAQGKDVVKKMQETTNAGVESRAKEMDAQEGR